jgi:iron complex outermembrane receptor protein
LGVSGFYTGNRLGGYNNTVGQTQIGSRLLPLKGFATIDLSAGYAIGKFTLQCKLSNICNTVNYLVHDNYSISPITPRQLTTTVACKF